MSKKLAPDEALDILVRREGDYVVVEFIDAKCQCWGGKSRKKVGVRVAPSDVSAWPSTQLCSLPHLSRNQNLPAPVSF
jgi:hypothetical protein